MNENGITLLPDIGYLKAFGAIMDKKLLLAGDILYIKIKRKLVARLGFQFASPDAWF
jgi:hypothetical protein